MKLQIQPWPNNAGFMLSVNTHDQVAGVSLSAVDAQVFRDLQSENQRLKEAIEQAWDESAAHIPPLPARSYRKPSGRFLRRRLR